MIIDGKRSNIDHLGHIKDVKLLSRNVLLIETDGAAFSFDEQIKESVEFRFLTNRASGVIELTFDGAPTRHDLYTEENGDIRILRRVKKCTPGDFSVSADLPRYDIDRLKIEAFEKDGLFSVTSAAIVSEKGAMNLPIRDNGVVSSLVLKDFKRDTERYFHPVQFAFQVFFAAMMAYLVVCGVRFLRLRGGGREVLTGGSRPAFWLMFAGALLVFSCWLIAYWPGKLTTDSIDIWRTAKIPGLVLNDHPVLNIIFYKFLQQIWDHVAVVGMVQITATAALGAYILYFVLKNGVTIWALLPFYFVFIFSVPVGLYNITLWKDAPFAFLVLFWSFYMAYLYFNKTRNIYCLSYESVVILLMMLAALCLVRYNGIVYIIAIPAAMVFLRLFPSKKMAASFLFPLFAVIAVVLVLFPFYLKTEFLENQYNIYTRRLKSTHPLDTTKMISRKFFRILDLKKTWHWKQTDIWVKDSQSVDWHHNFAKRKNYTDFLKYYDHKPLSNRMFQFMEAIRRAAYEKPWFYFSWNPFYFLWFFPLSLVLFRILPMSAIFSGIVLFQVVTLLAVTGTVNWRYYYYLLYSSFFLLPMAMLDLKLWWARRSGFDAIGRSS